MERSLIRLQTNAALAPIPFEKNTNDFHFDTEIIIQFVLRKLRIAELPIPTFYGNEVCHVNGMKYAWDVLKFAVKARLCGIHLFYDRKFDVKPEVVNHSDKLAFPSSQTFAVDSCAAGKNILQLGLGHANVAAELKRRGCRVTAIDFAKNEFAADSDTMCSAVSPSLPADLPAYDQILLMEFPAARCCGRNSSIASPSFRYGTGADFRMCKARSRPSGTNS